MLSDCKLVFRPCVCRVAVVFHQQQSRFISVGADVIFVSEQLSSVRECCREICDSAPDA